MLTNDAGVDFEDNDERAIFFARGVLETVKKLRWEPSLVHADGWFSGFVAAYLRHTFADDPIFSDLKIVVSIDDDKFDGHLDVNLHSKLEGEGINCDELSLLDDPTYENFCRFVILYADGIVISSESVDPAVLDIVRSSGKPVLEYQKCDEADYYDNYAKFYESI